MDIKFKSELWEWQGDAPWCFVTLPAEFYEHIKLISESPRKGFGSVKVEATIGKTSWKTSIFPDTKLKAYLLPVKKEVRKTENLEVGDATSVVIKLVDV